MLPKITENEFNQKLKAQARPVILLFKSEWCHYCKKILPIISEIADEYKNKADAFIVDVGEEQNLAAKYNILSIPVTIIFDKGKEVDRVVGFVSKEEIAEKIKAII